MAISNFFTPQAVGRSEFSITTPSNALAEMVAQEVRNAVGDVMVGSVPFGMNGMENNPQDGPEGQITGMNNGVTAGRIGSVAGMVLGVPGASLLGNALGSFVDLNNANREIDRARDLLGVDVENLGLRDYFSGLLSNATPDFFGLGTPIDRAYGQNVSEAVQNATPEQREAINRNDPAYWESQVYSGGGWGLDGVSAGEHGDGGQGGIGTW